MIHYSCDCCKRILDSNEDLRYVVKMEVYVAMDPLDEDEVEDDRDHLMEVEEILELMEDAESEAIGDDVYQKRRFDLCPECHKRFIKNPLGREPTTQLNFSDN